MHGADTRRVLLVGASGRVGRMVLSRWASSKSYPEIVPQYRSACAGSGIIWDPLKGPDELCDAIVKDGAFDVMIVLAGIIPNQGQPLELNTLLAEACLNAAKTAGIRRVLLASSSAVYGLGNGTPFSEVSPCSPVNNYGRSKWNMEKASERWRDLGIDLCALRIGNVAGADSLLVNLANASPEASIELDIFEDSHGPLRSYIGPRTLASVLQSISLYEGHLPAALNVAAPTPIYMETLVDALKHPWVCRRVEAQPNQIITLNCDLVSTIHTFQESDSLPEEMIRQWKGN